MTEFAAVIGARRREHDLTIREVATLADIKPVDVTAIEAGHLVPQPRTVERLAAVLSLPVDELLRLRLAAARGEREYE